MKPRVVLFGLPLFNHAQLIVEVFANADGNSSGTRILSTRNNDSGMILEYVNEDIDVGADVTIVLISNGTGEISFKLNFKGGDISYVPHIKKETNTSNKQVEKDWNLAYWKDWNSDLEHKKAIEQEKQFLLDKRISDAPIWESYYADSSIDYFEKFQKVWIALNAFMNHWSSETGDKKKTLSLVHSKLRQAFYDALDVKVQQHSSSQKWSELQKTTGLNMTSDVVRDEISISCHWLDFLEQAKSAKGLFVNQSKQLDGLTFLNNDLGKQVFINVFGKYHAYMASPEGMTQDYNLAKAFEHPCCPESIKRLGRLVYHDPYTSQTSGSLTNLEDYCGVDYGNDPYTGTSPSFKVWEQVDPLFFRYLELIYQFRCDYFHGDLPMNSVNNELAQTAYLSLREILPVVFK